METGLYKTLEYDQIRTLLAAEAGSIMGKELAMSMTPTGDLDEAEAWQEETAQAMTVLSVSNPPLGGFRDLRTLLQKVQKGALLELEEILAVMNTLYAMRTVKCFFKELGADVPVLKAWAHEIDIQGQLERSLETAIDEHGVIRDDATAELSKIRRGLRAAQRNIKDALTNILHDARNQKFFQEAIVTVREDRYVIPVKQEYRQAVPGIVHDQSATGATVFLEPMAVVNLNNDIKQLTLAEQQEILHILRRLTAQIGKSADLLLANIRILARLDFTFARAKLARAMRAVRPILNDEGRTNLLKARHPLIPQDEVVPIDLVLGMPNRMLLVTGPNTGGKTVSMKTLGLLALMAQSGCFVPAAMGAELSVYPRIYADIGDEQSIAQSLSTFSSHMKHLVAILAEVEADDLLLLDEIGAGTDPEEGAALAMAILERLQQVNASVIATTHYSELKTFAYTREGIENACVEFDVETLRPTYRLLIGIPGASNAFAISERLGLSKSLVLRAKELIEADHAQFETVINALEKEKMMYEQRNAEIAERAVQAKKTEEKLRQMKEAWTQKKTSMMKNAKSESAAMIRRARIESEEIIRQLKEQFQDQGIKKRQQTIQASRERLRNAAAEVRPEFSSNPKYRTPVQMDKIAVGDTVYVTTLDQKGTVVDLRGKKLEVQLGSLKTTVKSSDCRFVSHGSRADDLAEARQNLSSVFLQKTSTVQREIDIRGMLVDEGEQLVGKFIDDAAMAGLKQIRIIHGKGTGALRKGIQSYLKRHKSVAAFRFADIDEGGAGATVVDLR